MHPVIGESNVPGLWACNGFSGHGFKLAPAVGSLVAQQITGLKTDARHRPWRTTRMGPGREPLTLKVKTHFRLNDASGGVRLLAPLSPPATRLCSIV